MKKDILNEYKNFVLKKVNSKNFSFSPYKKHCLLFFNERDVYKDILFSDFSLLYRDGDNIIELLSYNNLIPCWHTYDTVYWSKGSRFCALSISPSDGNKKIWFKRAKLIMDIEEKLFTIIPLAGASEYGVKFINDTIEISTKKRELNYEYIEILKKATTLNNFKWLPFSDFHKAHKLFNAGYFGNLVGYKISEDNIYFEGAKNEWPYENL